MIHFVVIFQVGTIDGKIKVLGQDGKIYCGFQRTYIRINWESRAWQLSAKFCTSYSYEKWHKLYDLNFI